MSRIAVLSKKKGNSEKAEEFFNRVVPFYKSKSDFGYLAELAAEMGDDARKNTYISLAKILK